MNRYIDFLASQVRLVERYENKECLFNSSQLCDSLSLSLSRTYMRRYNNNNNNEKLSLTS